MQFHSYVHGSNIGLSKNDKIAIRNSSDTTFCDAITFSSKPISFNKSFELKIKSNAKKWRSCLSIGLTTKNPINFINNSYTQPTKNPINNYPQSNQTQKILLPQFASLISLSSQENFWLRELPIEWSNANLTFILTHNLNHAELNIVFNNEHQITFLHYLPVDCSFWLILDLFGQTDFVEIIEPNLDLNFVNEEKLKFYERIPNPVILNGPNFIEQYKRSCIQSSVKFNSGRIFLIGPSCSGKSLLKRVLLGMNNESAGNNYEENRSLDASLKCYSNGKGSWSNENPKLGAEVDVLTKEEQYENLAYNFAKMILIQQQKTKQNQSGDALNELDVEKSKIFNDTIHNISSIFKNALKFSIKNNKQSNDNHFDNIGHNECETDLNEIVLPDKIKEQLNLMLNKKDEILKEEEFNNTNQSQLIDSYVYRMYDFSGNFVYFLLNQVILSSHAIYLLVIDISNDLETPTNQLKSSSIQVETKKCDINTINVINFWLSVIYSHVANPSVSFSKENDAENDAENQRSNSSSSRNCNSPQASNSFLTTNAKITTPKVIIVATHRNSVHTEPITRNQLIEETFEKIRKNLLNKPYNRLVHTEYFAVDCKQMAFDELKILDKLRLLIDNEFINQNLVNNCIPFAWLEFEHLINKLKKRGINFIDYMQLGELIKTQIEDENYFQLQSASSFNSNLQMLINFYHLQGRLFSFNTAYQGYTNETLIVLDPIWFMNCFYKICDFVLKVNKENKNLLVSGVLREELLNNVWSDQLDQKLVLVGCLEKLDLICELRPCLSLDEQTDVYNNQLRNQLHSQFNNQLQTKAYIFPWITQILPEAINKTGLFYDSNPSNSLKLHAMFNVYLPVGLFSRLIVRLCRWSWSQGYGRKPEICHSEARIAVDYDHDLVLKLHLKKHRIDLVIIKIFENLQNESSISLTNQTGPSASVCVKVRHLVESEMEFIQSVYYRRISWILKVICPCELKCSEHETLNCQQEDCLHFLPLDECLNKKFVECDYRQIRTSFVAQYFPSAHLFNIQYTNNGSVILYNNQNDNSGSNYNYYSNDCTNGQSNSLQSNREQNRILLGNILNNLNSNQTNSGSNNNSNNNFYELINSWDSMFQMEPTWLRNAAKQLQKKNESGQDWVALSKRLGYLAKDIKRLRSEEEQTPALALLRDWYESNGRTRYCIDILISCLHIIGRNDVKELIENDIKPEGSSPPIFLSYQWHSQDQVLELRRKLELSGFPCWMDMSSIRGGDQLYGKIYEGISNCKVVICCLTPKYSASRSCTREVTLADVLHKPILPLMLESTPWPPPGPMALIMSSLVYIDLCGIGGHGGIGRRGDNESRFREILDRISRYIAGYVDLPLFNRNYMLPDLFQTQQNQDPDTILIMAANSNTNGLNVLQEIDRDGVELRLINNNLLNNNLNNNANQSLVEQSSNNQNESTDEGDLVSLLSGGESQQTLINSNSNSESNSGQILSVNGLENLIGVSSNNSNSDSQNQQNPNALEQRRSSININQESNQDTNRVEIYSLNEFDRRSLNRAISANSANNQVSNCSICNII